ncbi:hypothetical protein JT359_19155 [Candidatus Poribacteria bacterium]|nr:hypothetical protein [Candidatus Poribacteria bacterium]
MNNLYHRQSYIFIVMLLLPYTVCWHIHAQDDKSSISGHVVDAKGDPVGDIELAIKPIIMKRGYEKGIREPFSSWSKTTTDKDGSFKLTNVSPGPSRFVILPELGSPYEIISIEIWDITVHSTAFRQSHPTWYGKPTFSIDPGETIENVIVNVQEPRMWVSGRVLMDDGTPLKNTDIHLTVYNRDRDTFLFVFSSGGGGGLSGRIARTDAHGYYVSYAPDDDEEYCVSVRYKGVFAKSRWFRLKKGERKDNITIRLRGLKKELQLQEERKKMSMKMWSVNPENNHAYKKIECSSWNDALEKAKTENAYLLTIEDEAEQKWIESRFSDRVLFWVGQQTFSEDNTLIWKNGNPVKYTNWLNIDKNLNTSISKSNVPIALLFSNKKWIPIETNNPLNQFVKYAIIEKDEY